MLVVMNLVSAFHNVIYMLLAIVVQMENGTLAVRNQNLFWICQDLNHQCLVNETGCECPVLGSSRGGEWKW